MEKKNFFDGVPLPAFSGEHFDTLFHWGDYKIERILSNAHADEDDNWYDQEQDEWVMLVRGEAKLMFEHEGELSLKAGDYLFIPAHKKHRVTFTSTEPGCFWLAIHGKLTDNSQD